MFRLMGKTFYGREPRGPGGRAPVHESPADDDAAARAARDPRRCLGLAIGWPPDAGLVHQWLEPVFAQARRRRSACTEEAFQVFGIDGALIIVSVALAAIGVIAAVGSSVSVPGRDANAGRRSCERPTARLPAPVPRLAQQVVVRRAVTTCSSSASAAPWRACAVVVRRARRRRDGQRHRGAAPVDTGRERAPDPDRPRPELRARDRHRPDRDGRAYLPRGH